MSLSLSLSLGGSRGAAAVVPIGSPLELANLWGWYDASDAGSVTLVSGNVSQWSDKGPLLNHVVQTDPPARPVYSATGLAGTQPGLTFDGTKHLSLTGIVLTAGTLLHAFAVVRPTGTKSYNRVVTFATTAGFDYADGYTPIMRDVATDNWSNYVGGVGFSGSGVILANDQTAVLGSIRTDASNHLMSKNGTAAASAAQAYPGGALTRLTFGSTFAREAAGEYFGVISEIIILAGAPPTVGERASIQAYLAGRWTLT